MSYVAVVRSGGAVVKIKVSTVKNENGKKIPSLELVHCPDDGVVGVW
jgi:hypothetical protein